jgi:prevent-host-death family protein
MNVGIRELKAHLSEYVARAAGGEEVVVTDRSRPVARLVPFAGVTGVDRGIEEGWIEAPRRTRLDPVEPVRSTRSTLEVLDEDRG